MEKFTELKYLQSLNDGSLAVFLDVVRFGWGFIFFAAILLKIQSTSMADDWQVWLYFTVDVIGLVACFSNWPKFAWLVLGALIGSFILFKSFQVTEDCNCFGSAELDRQLVLTIEWITLPICILGLVCSPRRSVQLRVISYGIIPALLLFFAVVLQLAGVHRHVDRTVDLSIGKTVDRIQLKRELNDLNVFVYHSECQECLLKIRKIVNSGIDCSPTVFLDISGQADAKIESETVSWQSTDGFPIGIRSVPSVVKIRNGAVIGVERF